MNEKSQRYGSTSIPGSGRLDHIDLNTVLDKAKVADEVVKTTYKDKNPNRGYGGKFGTEKVMDKVSQVSTTILLFCSNEINKKKVFLHSVVFV